MSAVGTGQDVLFHIGPLAIGSTVVTTWGIMLLLGLLCALAARGLGSAPSRWQAALEVAVAAIEAAVAEVIPAPLVRRVLPFVGTLWVFILLANLAGLVPGLHAPTGDLSTTAALALLVFGSTHWFGIRTNGWRAYLRHYIEPSVILLPFHVISEFTRGIALAVRLFGNIMSLEMAALLVLLIAGFLVPVPLLLLHLVEALVQAYIFGMLALIYIGGAMENTGAGASSPKPEKVTTP